MYDRADIVRILMDRDGMTKEDAEGLVDTTITEVNYAIEYGGDAEQVIADNLGLEPDYLFALIDF